MDETMLRLVDQLVEQTRASVLESLTATIDVERELGELYGAGGEVHLPAVLAPVQVDVSPQTALDRSVGANPAANQ